jgi:hypothetical protein
LATAEFAGCFVLGAVLAGFDLLIYNDLPNTPNPEIDRFFAIVPDLVLAVLVGEPNHRRLP